MRSRRARGTRPAVAAALVGVLLAPVGPGADARAGVLAAAPADVREPGGAGPPPLLASRGASPTPTSPPLSALQAAAAAGVPDLPAPPTGRRRGLPVVVALVALLGAGSLVVRVLLAVPVRRRR